LLARKTTRTVTLKERKACFHVDTVRLLTLNCSAVQILLEHMGYHILHDPWLRNALNPYLSSTAGCFIFCRKRESQRRNHTVLIVYQPPCPLSNLSDKCSCRIEVYLTCVHTSQKTILQPMYKNLQSHGCLRKSVAPTSL